MARERKNKARQVRCNHAHHRKEEWAQYEALAVTSSNDAWLQRQLTNSAYVTKKQNDSAEIVMLSEPLHHVILS
jgi:hypothetical protein